MHIQVDIDICLLLFFYISNDFNLIKNVLFSKQSWLYLWCISKWIEFKDHLMWAMMSKIGILEWNNKYVLLYTDHSGFKRYNILKQASLTWPLCTEHLKTREGVSISVKSPFSIVYRFISCMLLTLITVFPAPNFHNTCLVHVIWIKVTESIGGLDNIEGLIFRSWIYWWIQENRKSRIWKSNMAILF